MHIGMSGMIRLLLKRWIAEKDLSGNVRNDGNEKNSGNEINSGNEKNDRNKRNNCDKRDSPEDSPSEILYDTVTSFMTYLLPHNIRLMI
jgi:hypothetical protein